MCTSEAKVTIGVPMSQPAAAVARINGRPVLQPSSCNRVPSLERRNSAKKLTSAPSLTLPPPPPHPSSSSLASPRIPPTPPRVNPNTTSSLTPPISPKSKSPRPPAIKRGNDLNLSSEKILIPPPGRSSAAKLLERKKSKSFRIASGSGSATSDHDNGISVDHILSSEAAMSYPSSLITEAPGSIAAVRREQMALQHAQRKMRIAHYGRSKSAKFDQRIVSDVSDPYSSSIDHHVLANNSKINTTTIVEEKRCSFITANSDPIYVAYHDQEWGVPVHDDKMLFELLVLSGAQVGSDWTSILKKRQEFREAFSGFDAETASTFTDKQIISITSHYAIDISRVLGVIDNSNRILEVKKEFGSFDKYIWGFVNHKPISTQYKSGQRIPVKTSKSETISKDMVRRGFRFVGPTVVHSFMQASGLTNDHLTTCHRHLQCTLLAAAPACLRAAATLSPDTTADAAAATGDL